VTFVIIAFLQGVYICVANGQESHKNSLGCAHDEWVNIVQTEMIEP